MILDMEGAIITSNNVMKDPNTGKFIPGSKPANIITSETSADLHRARREKMRQAAAAAIARGTNTRNSIAGMAYGIEKLVERAVSGDEDLDKSRKALLSAGRVAGLIDDTRQTLDNSASSDTIPRETIELIRDTALAIGKLLGTV